MDNRSPRDFRVRDMRPYPIVEFDDTPEDGFGPEYLVHSIRSDFEDLVRFIGFEAARSELAEVINDARCLKGIRNDNH